MIFKVSRLSGISGIRKIGNVSGNLPKSLTVRVSVLNSIATRLSTMMHTKGEGISLPIFGIYGNK